MTCEYCTRAIAVCIATVVRKGKRIQDSPPKWREGKTWKEALCAECLFVRHEQTRLRLEAEENAVGQVVEYWQRTRPILRVTLSGWIGNHPISAETPRGSIQQRPTAVGRAVPSAVPSGIRRRVRPGLSLRPVPAPLLTTRRRRPSP